MRAYHGDAAIKERYLDRVRAHRAADELVQGYGYWADGRGCAVGCTLHSAAHADYETELGIPQMLAHLEDQIFEGLPVDMARVWPERFLAAIAPGADLSRVGPWVLHDLVARRREALSDLDISGTLRAQLTTAMDLVLAVLRQWAEGGVLDAHGIDAAWSAARSAASAAWSAAWDAASDAAMSRSAIH